jgi:hypothetical protein
MALWVGVDDIFTPGPAPAAAAVAAVFAASVCAAGTARMAVMLCVARRAAGPALAAGACAAPASWLPCGGRGRGGLLAGFCRFVAPTVGACAGVIRVVGDGRVDGVGGVGGVGGVVGGGVAREEGGPRPALPALFVLFGRGSCLGAAPWPRRSFSYESKWFGCYARRPTERRPTPRTNGRSGREAGAVNV